MLSFCVQFRYPFGSSLAESSYSPPICPIQPTYLFLQLSTLSDSDHHGLLPAIASWWVTTKLPSADIFWFSRSSGSYGLDLLVVGDRWLLPYPAEGAVCVGQSRQNFPCLDVCAGPASGRTSGAGKRPLGITGKPLWTWPSQNT